MFNLFMMRVLPAVMALVLALPASAQAKESKWHPIDTSKGRVTAGVLNKAYIEPSIDGQYQLRMVGKKFAAVFTNEGMPVAVFDLTLHELTFRERILGAIGFGDMSLWKLVKGIWKKKSVEKKANSPTDAAGESDLALTDEDSVDDAQGTKILSLLSKFVGKKDDLNTDGEMSAKDRAKAIKRGMKFFKGMRFNDGWAHKHGLAASSNGKGYPFELADFSVADIQLDNEKDRRMFEVPFIKLATILYPSEEWGSGNIRDFMEEMEFRYDDKKPGYDLVWNIAARKTKKQPPLPGIVANFIDPYSALVYKNALRQFDQYGAVIISQLGPAGIVMDLIISRMVHGLSERLDYHERQFIALLEATQRFEYQANLPTDLVDVMTDMVYLSHFDGLSDPDLTDGVAKRKNIRAAEEAARPIALKRLEQLNKKGDLVFQEIVEGKFGIAWRAPKPGEEHREFRGIYGLALKPSLFAKRPALHVHPTTAAWKILERYTAEMVGFIARAIIPGNIGFRVGKISLGISVPPALYQNLLRGRTIAETELEGELVGLVDEAIAGRYQLPLTPEQLLYVQKHLRKVDTNPYELSLDEEPVVIEKNLRILKKLLAGDKSIFSNPKLMVPYSM